MDDQRSLSRTVAFGVAGYPLYLARTLIQLGYEPKDPNQHGHLPNLFSYLSIIRGEHGYFALYTGLRYYLPAMVIKKTSYDFMASITNHKKEADDCDASEVIAVCLKESLLKVSATIITYPCVTLGVGYITKIFFGIEDNIEISLSYLYRGLIPKLIIEVAMVWVSIISRRLTVGSVKDEIAQAIISRIPPFIVQATLYPLNVVSTVMADNGRSKLNPRFNDWLECYRYLSRNNQLKRGSSIFYRRDYRTLAGSQFSFIPRILPSSVN